jgi:trehalose 6-phosphate synthase/phosphatase
MDIVSYRGPGAAGGVSTGLDTARRSQRHPDASWWFLSNDALSTIRNDSENVRFITQIADTIVKGHYHFCNEFLWPVMHDLPQYATYRLDDYSHYCKFNRLFGEYINFEQRRNKRFFINDYQLALLPAHLGKAGNRSVAFWHIPWPKNVDEEYKSVIADIASGLLAADSIGFHTNEYAENFAAFVLENMPQYVVSAQSRFIRKRQAPHGTHMSELERDLSDSYILRPYRYPQAMPTSTGTQVVVHPLGIDGSEWSKLADAHSDDAIPDVLKHLAGQRIILSVDRADYTKAVHDRMRIVDRFFEENPFYRNRISFVQICGRSRAGIAAFDQYWDRCQQLARAVNERWRSDNWAPIEWLEKPLPPKELSHLYKHATAMLVNPVRDGLNLTAKEFIACQESNPGVLMLSPGAGAWQELGEYALPADPLKTHQTCDSIAQALTMPTAERKMRYQLLKNRLDRNPMQSWWRSVTQQQPAAATGSLTALHAEEPLRKLG